MQRIRPIHRSILYVGRVVSKICANCAKSKERESIKMPIIRAVWPPLALTSASSCLLGYGLIHTNIPAIAVGAALTAVFTLDTLGRLRDFDKLAIRAKHDVRHHPVTSWRTYRRSWCGRTMYRHFIRKHHPEAAPMIRIMEEAHGYKWFHIFPDKTFTRDSKMLRLKYWLTLWRTY